MNKQKRTMKKHFSSKRILGKMKWKGRKKMERERKMDLKWSRESVGGGS
jgi:hypothetical protein